MELMSNMVNSKNVKKVLNEFYEYHKDINGEFVCISINYLTKIALMNSESANYGLELLIKILNGMTGEENSDILDCLSICSAKLIRSFPDSKKSLELT